MEVREGPEPGEKEEGFARWRHPAACTQRKPGDPEEARGDCHPPCLSLMTKPRPREVKPLLRSYSARGQRGFEPRPVIP